MEFMKTKTTVFWGIMITFFSFFLIGLKAVSAEEIENTIVNDAWVFKNSPNGIFGNTKNNVVGYGCHTYIRLKIDTISMDNIDKINLNFQKYNNANTIVITRANDYLSKDGKNTDVKWNNQNLTYNNRPIDMNNTETIEVKVAYGELSASANITTFIKAAKDEGESYITLHLTTKDVDDAKISGTDIYSTRADLNKQPYVDATYMNVEIATNFPIVSNWNNYLEDAETAQKIVLLKNEQNEYIAVDSSGRLYGTVNREAAAMFAIYGYNYAQSPYNGSGGAQEVTYAIKCLNNGKFLTIQNYDTSQNSSYYNKAGSGKYQIFASAQDVKWNERFLIKTYSSNNKVLIYSHLDSLRDGSESAKSPISLDETGLYAVSGDKKEYKFSYEEVKDSDLLEVFSQTDGNQSILSWLPINGDVDGSHYSIVNGNGTISLNNGVFNATISNLSSGEHAFTVMYNNGSVKKTDEVKVTIFNHPGVSLTMQQLHAMKDHIQKKEEPWYSDYLRLVNTVPNQLSSADFPIVARSGVGRGNPEGSGNISDFEESSAAAYFNALQWVITGEEKFGKKTADILDTWGSQLKIVDGRDQILGASLATLKMINASEILRYYDGGFAGYSTQNHQMFNQMLLNVIYPVIQDGGAPMNANGNWDVIPMMTMIAIGVATDNTSIFNRAVAMYQDPEINGSIVNYISDTGQTVESARDQAHGQLGIGAMGDICNIAYHQNVNLWELYDNRLGKAFNWAAQYNLFSGEGELVTNALPNIYGRTDIWAYWTEMDQLGIYRGQLRPIYETALSYYQDTNLDVTWMKKAADAERPEGFNHFDNLNFSTLTMYNGKPTLKKAQPYFKLRTMITPNYQSTWDEVRKYGEVPSPTILNGTIPSDLTEETLNSYFGISDDSEVTVKYMEKDAPMFRLITNDDGTYSIQNISNRKYLSVTDETVGNEKVIKAISSSIGENEKFHLRNYGVSRWYLSSPKYNNRLVKVTSIADPNDKSGQQLLLRLGEKVEGINRDTSVENWLLFMYQNSDSTVDKTNLVSMYEMYKDLDGKDYTEKSWNTFKEALINAKTIIDDEDATQQSIDDALESLKASFSKLSKKEETTSSTTESSTTESSTTENSSKNTNSITSNSKSNEKNSDKENDSEKKLPNTGAKNSWVLSWVGGLLLVVIAVYVIFRNIKKYRK
ncbi:alginate lyase family protein [Enterococcus camelliae]|uniref:Alginate lyase family protein n=1 Tax=Enterococcus camelliae TaxID=453959 RepID=A0ABW5THW2_9ENTE